MEDSFSTDGEGQVGGGSGGNANDGEREMKLHSLARHSPPAVQLVPNRPRTAGDPCPTGQGKYIYLKDNTQSYVKKKNHSTD